MRRFLPWAVGALTLAAIVLLVLAPVGALVLEALHGVLGAQRGARLLPHDWTHHLAATLALAGLTAGLAAAAGTGLATLVDAAPPRGIGWIEPVLLSSFFLPPYLTALAWTLIAGPQGLCEQLLGGGGGALATALYSLPGMAAVMALHLTPLVYLMVRAALARVDRRFGQVAQVHGASKPRALWMTWRPGVLPAVLAATLLVFLAGMEEFGVPKVLGDLAGVQVLSVAVEQAMDVWPIDLPRASAIGLLLGTLAAIAWLLALPLSRPQESGVLRQPRKRVVWSLLPLLGFVALSSGLPITAIVVAALQKAVTAGVAADNWTLAHIEHVLTPGEGGLDALRNSLVLAMATSLIGMTLATGALLALQRLPPRWRQSLETIGYAPQAIPGVVMATGLILFWNAPVNPIRGVYGHLTILVVAYLALTLPYALRYAGQGLQQVPSRLIDAALVHGASQAQAVTRISLPLAFPSLAAGAVMLFAFSMRELAASILLQPPGVQVISTYVYAQFDQGSVADGMALAVIGALLTLFVLVTVRALTRVVGKMSAVSKQAVSGKVFTSPQRSPNSMA